MTKLDDRLAIRARVLGEDIRIAARAARDIGYRGAQLDLMSPGLDLASLSASGQREVRHIVAREGLTLESVRAELPAEALMRQTGLDRVVWFMDRAMQAAAGLGAGMLCAHVGRLPEAKVEHVERRPIAPQNAGLIIVPESMAAPIDMSDDEGQDDAQWPTVDEIMRDIGGRADRYQVIVAFAGELSSYASLRRLLRGAGCSWFGVDLDPVSVLRDRCDIERVLDAIGPMVRHVRGRDAAKGAGGRTQPAEIGRGTTDWSQLLSLLNAGGFGGWIAVDTMDLPDRTGEARRAREALIQFGEGR